MKKYFTIYGRAVAKARPRVTKRGYTYTPKTTKEFETKVKEAYLKQCGEMMFSKSTPLEICIEFQFAPPKSWSKGKRKKAKDGELFPTCRPDVDNLCKSIEDALNGVAYYDDSQIVAMTARKIYAGEDKTSVEIRAIDIELIEGVPQ